jgi:LPS-assembly protein
VKRYRLFSAVASILLLSALARDADAAQWRCGVDADGVWGCHDISSKTPTKPTAAPGETPAKRTRSKAPQAHQAAPATDERWKLCPPAPAAVTVETPGNGDELPINLYADTAESAGQQVFTLRGNAVVRYGAQQLEADSITYNTNNGEVEAQGNLHYSRPDLLVSGDFARLFPDKKQGVLYDADYALPEQHGRGNAATIHLLDAHHEQLDQATYTTCPPGNSDWLLSARQVDLDTQNGRGVAHHANMRLKGVPVLYTPYINYPIDGRRHSGLLIPKFGTSQETGLDISVPYYWNIAPNYDATLIPRVMSKRGVMMNAEFRYLHPKDSGTVAVEYLPSDKEYDNKSRSLMSFVDNANPMPHLTTSLNAGKVSDKDYFQDLGTSLVQTSQSFLGQEAKATYHGNRWTLDTRLLNFQTVDPTVAVANRPYTELPQILFSAAPAQRLLGMQLNMDSELTQFEKDKAVSGTRLDLLPQLSLPIEHTAWYVKPAAGIRYTSYRLKNQTAGDPESPQRTTAIADLDAGMFFDRTFQWGGSAYLQTLEPRLYYLYVPYKEQDDIPVFDTGEYDFSFWQLFLNNRFSGPDRMGDANQLSTALTTRVLDPESGVQRLRASLGQITYFRNLKVTLPGQPVDKNSSSDLIGELGMAISREWNVATEIQWDPSATDTDRGDVLLQYRADKRQLVNLSYRYRRASMNQTDIAVLWPLGNAWHLVGRWNYSLDNSATLDSLAGFGYESCCWALQLVGRSYINNVDGSRNSGVFAQVEFKGLTSTGSQVDSLLEHGILDYNSSY